MICGLFDNFRTVRQITRKIYTKRTIGPVPPDYDSESVSCEIGYIVWEFIGSLIQVVVNKALYRGLTTIILSLRPSTLSFAAAFYSPFDIYTLYFFDNLYKKLGLYTCFKQFRNSFVIGLLLSKFIIYSG